MRKACLDMVYELATRDPRVVFIGSDLSPGLLMDMKRELPDRYFMEGVSEANVVGMAAGLALDGYIPYVNTIATFITRRCYEQVALDACLHDLPIRFIGNGGGLVYAPLGPTHLAIEDIAILRALPNMTIVAPADAPEMRRFMPQTLEWRRPIYIRLAKGGDPVVSEDRRGFTIGKAILMLDAPAAVRPVLLVTTGVTTNRALQAAALLDRDGIGCRVLHVHTIKPFDDEALRAGASGASLVVTVEEHTLMGGLGSAVIESLCDGRISAPVKRIGIPDVFAKHYGSQDDLMHTYGLQPHQIAETVRNTVADLDHASRHAGH